VVVIFRHLKKTGEYEGGYEAVTMMGVPHPVSVIGSDRKCAQAALNHAPLLQNLISIP